MFFLQSSASNVWNKTYSVSCSFSHVGKSFFRLLPVRSRRNVGATWTPKKRRHNSSIKTGSRASCRQKTCKLCKLFQDKTTTGRYSTGSLMHRVSNELSNTYFFYMFSTSFYPFCSLCRLFFHPSACFRLFYMHKVGVNKEIIIYNKSVTLKRLHFLCQASTGPTVTASYRSSA